MSDFSKSTFGTWDYVVFVIMLIISAGIGVYYAFADRKKNDSQEFLMGGRSMSVFPVAMSVLASFMSAITLLGTPAEVFRYGTQYVMILIAFCFVIPSTAYLYLPVFYNLGITSAYEYLELRFHRSVRSMGSILFILQMLLYMPIVLYAPALALSEVTGIDIWFAVLSVGLVCTFYTSIGGIKAVIWTDLFQSLIMYGSILVVVVKGIYDVGGINAMWERNNAGHRVEFWRFDFDPTVRHTFWSLVIGGYLTWMGNYAANQAMIQRYLTISSLRSAQGCIWINLPALLLLIAMTWLAGLVIHAFYWVCDPIGTKQIEAPDQLFPHFVMETLGDFPGVPGLFVSGIFSGALSTVSSGVNSLAAVTLEDFIKTYVRKDISEIWATRMTKIIAMLYGLLSIALVFLAKELGGVLQAALAIFGIVGGPMLGLFTLGMFFSLANTKGAAVGLVSGFTIAMWFGIGAFVSKPYNPEAPYSYDNCTHLYFNVTNIDLNIEGNIPIQLQDNNDEIFLPYRLSYLWLSAVAFGSTLIIGLVVSLLTASKDDPVVDDRLLSPAVHWLRLVFKGSRSKKLKFNYKESKDTSKTTLKTTNFMNDDDFYPSKRVSISCIDVSDKQ